MAYYGGSFTFLEQDLLEGYLGAAAPFLEAGLLDGIRVSTRPDGLPQSMVELLRQRGVTTVEIGCQSFCGTVLRRVGRGHGPEEASGAVSRLKKAGIAVGLQLMPGLPGGGEAEALVSLKRALDLAPDFLRIYPAVVLAGTALEDDFRCGRYAPLGLEEAVELCARMVWLCRRAGVPVIRTGLQGSIALEAGSVVAGPYHPAFGQLVRSRLWLRALEGLAAQGVLGADVNPAELSDAMGHKKSNLEALRSVCGCFEIGTDSAVPRGQVDGGGRRYALQSLVFFKE